MLASTRLKSKTRSFRYGSTLIFKKAQYLRNLHSVVKDKVTQTSNDCYVYGIGILNFFHILRRS